MRTALTVEMVTVHANLAQVALGLLLADRRHSADIRIAQHDPGLAGRATGAGLV